MEHQFYLYGTYGEGSDTLEKSDFSFNVDSNSQLQVPSFLIWLFRDTESKALLCKIRRTKRSADIGMTVYVCDAVPIRISVSALLNTLDPNFVEEMGMTTKTFLNDMVLRREIHCSLHDHTEFVKNVIIKNNVGVINPSYFSLDSLEKKPSTTEIVVEATDAIHTGLRIFQASLPIPHLVEHQILDFDIATIFGGAQEKLMTADGKHFFDYQGRRLYLHKVDRTLIERCLGVDLIYNYLDQRRLVFVQYKCQKAKGNYYPATDSSHDSEIERMASIPGLAGCPNLIDEEPDGIRLCRCPVFIKLCKREIAHSNAVPVGVYFPLCVWKRLVKQQKSICVNDDLHINNQNFQELVKTGLIGSTPLQSKEIENHLVTKANDGRLKLIFEEESLSPGGPQIGRRKRK